MRRIDASSRAPVLPSRTRARPPDSASRAALQQVSRFARLAADWDSEVSRFRKVMPSDYKHVLTVMREAEQGGFSEEEALERVMISAHG